MDPDSPENVAMYNKVMALWKEYRKGNITQSELDAKLNCLSLKTELNIIKVSTPESVRQAGEIFGGAPRVEHGCPIDQEER